MSHPDLSVCEQRVSELEARLADLQSDQHGVLHRDELLGLMEETLAEWRRRRETLIQNAESC